MTILAAFLAVANAPLSTIDCVRSMRMTMSFGIDVAASMYHGLQRHLQVHIQYMIELYSLYLSLEHATITCILGRTDGKDRPSMLGMQRRRRVLFRSTATSCEGFARSCDEKPRAVSYCRATECRLQRRERIADTVLSRQSVANAEDYFKLRIKGTKTVCVHVSVI